MNRAIKNIKKKQCGLKTANSYAHNFDWLGKSRVIFFFSLFSVYLTISFSMYNLNFNYNCYQKWLF